MRIAPKPKVGQEISLDRLLAKTVEPQKQTVAPFQNVISASIGQLTLHGVDTMEGRFDFEVSKHILEGLTRGELLTWAIVNEEAGEFRPASAYEFYAMAKFISDKSEGGPHGDMIPYKDSEGNQLYHKDTGQTRALDNVEEFLSEAIQGRLTLLTTIHYSPYGDDAIHHNPGLRVHTEKKANLKDVLTANNPSGENAALNVFGAGSKDELLALLARYSRSAMRLIRYYQTDHPDLACGVSITPGETTLRQEDNFAYTRALLIRRKQSTRTQA